MERIEFRTAPDGMLYYKVEGKEERRLTRFSEEIIAPMAEMIRERFPECYAKLVKLYGGKKLSKIEVSLMVERFIRCNFGEHDLLTQDIDHDIMNFEEVRCPLRGGFCPHENIICKPKGLIHLTPSEQEVVKLYLEGLTYKEVAERLEKNPSTVKAQLFQVKKRLGLQNCREIIRVCRAKNY